MGHERIGILPKTKQWRNVVQNISEFSFENNNISDIAQSTIRNVRIKFDLIHKDSGIQSAFEFFVILTAVSKFNNPQEILSKKGIYLPKDFNPLQLAKSINEWISNNQGSLEYAAFASQSAIDTISEWYRKSQTNQSSLFDFGKNPFEVWQNAANGAGFSDLSRIFFSKFTERYLKYFLEREASAYSSSIASRENFNRQLEKHVKEISKHAFETTKITQSFAAGWYNKNLKDEIPSRRKIAGFLSVAFGKLKGELLREEVK